LASRETLTFVTFRRRAVTHYITPTSCVMQRQAGGDASTVRQVGVRTICHP
jgi:hypothetical protein